MPYAVFSKRTGIISRIVDNLDSLLDSESILELDEDTNFQREYATLIEGQNINTLGFPLFQDANSFATFKPQSIVYDAADRPHVLKHKPIYVAPTDVAGNPLTQWSDLSIASHPFAWDVSSAAAVKYESILAKNAPFNVVIGEEFITEDHIVGGSSSGYVISEGMLWLAPGGTVVTSEFQFLVTTQGQMTIDAADDRDAKQYVFDTYYLATEPEPPEGVNFFWRGREWASPATVSDYYEMTHNDVMPTTYLNGSATAATLIYGIQLKITNVSSVSLPLENYLLMLRIRNLPT